MELLNATVPEVGAWFDLDLTVGGGTGLSLAAKIIDTNMCGNFFHHFGPFWTISHAFVSSTPPHTRRGLRATWCLC